MMVIKWHTLSIEEVFSKLQTSKNGLSEKEVKKRLKIYGPNELPKPKRPRLLTMFLRQFKSFLILLLLAAILISIGIKHYTDALVILVILMLNALLGFYQEYKAEKAVEALKELAVTYAKVIRDGKVEEIPAKKLVPGDILVLEEGDKVPADARLIEITSLKVDESALTGESTPVFKDVRAIKDVPLAERKNMVFMGTIIAYGRAKAVVVATGIDTEMGKITKIIQIPEEETPLQKRLNDLGKKLGIFIIAICVVVFFIGILLHETSIAEMFLTSISLAVAAVPEGLPAVVAVTLALGTRRMAKRNAIVKRLAAVEALGCVTVICADKTGTMTTNEMTVREIWYNNSLIKVTGIGFEPKGEFFKGKKKINPIKDKDLSLLLELCTNCNNAELKEPSLLFDKWHVIGDPTDGALLVLAKKAGVDKKLEKVGEIPFSSERKRMTTIHRKNGKYFTFSKGAPETIVKLCDRILFRGRVKNLSEDERKDILNITQNMALRGLRVIALAFKPLEKISQRKFLESEVERNLIFLGLVGMIDPPRKEVKNAVRTCKQAGIKVIMITGDHKLTAIAIAKELGIYTGREEVIVGEELEKMSEEELDDVIDKVSVFARVSPEHKTRILSALKRKGHIVAMTGDGVNDAPALKKADIGVAMGIKGTDVAKEAADMILTDDNFATIAKAVEEGRGIYDNIKKFIRFLLSSNFDEILVVTIASLAGLPLPLLPIHILWINLVTDGLPALSLSVDPKEPDIMKRKPRNPKESILSGVFWFSLTAGLIACAVTLLAFFLEYTSTLNVLKARTLALTTTIFFELLFVFNCRSETRSVFSNNPLTNKKLVLAVILSVVFQLLIIYVPPLQTMFKTTSLTFTDWIRVLLFSASGLFILPSLFRLKK
jgi:Ca2+-transporting ATPase